jgi:hypothetical protein
MLVNGRPFSWSELAINAKGTRYYECKSFSYKHGMERGIQWGTAQANLGVTKGRYTPEASIELGMGDALAFKKDLGDGWLNVQFHVTATFGSDDGLERHVVNFEAKLKEDAFDGSAGVEPMSIKLPLQVIGRITEDGKDPIGSATA